MHRISVLTSLLSSIAPAAATSPVPSIVSTVATASDLTRFAASLEELGKCQAALESDKKTVLSDFRAHCERVASLKTTGLPADLEAVCEELRKRYHDAVGSMKEVPGSFPMGNPELIADWMRKEAPANPGLEAAVNLLGDRLDAFDLENAVLEERLLQVASGHGVNVLGFIDPDSIGRTLPPCAEGKTSPAELLKALESNHDRFLNDLKEASTGGKLATIGDLAAMLHAQAVTLMEIPAGGLPEELGIALGLHRRAALKHAWLLQDIPAETPTDKHDTAVFTAELARKKPELHAAMLVTGRKLALVSRQEKLAAARLARALESAGQTAPAWLRR